MSEQAPLHVVITGASSGLGEALAYAYARRGAKVGLFARRRAKLEEVAEACLKAGAADARPLVGDTAERADVLAAVGELDRAWGRVDRAFLNAGAAGDRTKAKREEHFIQCCSGDDLTAAAFSADAAEWVMRVNYLGVVYWLEPMLERMRRQRSGTIAVTGSMAADGNLPRSGPYTATKVALRALLEGLRYDARKFGVQLSLIEPAWFVSEQADPKSKAPFIMSTDAAAARVMKGVEAGEKLIRFPGQMSVISRVAAIMPREVRDRFWDHYLPPLDAGREET
jgi:NADP-dependent 3-hydroxy acid dehydrogenase YdfG